MSEALMFIAGVFVGMTLLITYLLVLSWWVMGGMSRLKLLNMITRGLFGRVLVRIVDVDTGQTLRYYWDAANKHPLKEVE